MDKQQLQKTVFPIAPLPKPRMTRSDSWKMAKGEARPCVSKYFTWKDELKLQASKNNFAIEGILFVKFVLPLPKRTSKKKKLEMIGTPHLKRPDTDNLIKAFQDALLKEDSMVWCVFAIKVWGEEGAIEVAPNLKLLLDGIKENNSTKPVLQLRA
jgi:Holliday junction resolvase RusA-like endonuclease